MDCEEFERLNGTHEDGEYETIMMLTLRTYGNKDQLDQSLERLKDELQLQGFDVDISDVHSVLKKNAFTHQATEDPGVGHAKRN